MRKYWLWPWLCISFFWSVYFWLCLSVGVCCPLSFCVWPKKSLFLSPESFCLMTDITIHRFQFNTINWSLKFHGFCNAGREGTWNYQLVCVSNVCFGFMCVRVCACSCSNVLAGKCVCTEHDYDWLQIWQKPGKHARGGERPQVKYSSRQLLIFTHDVLRRINRARKYLQRLYEYFGEMG